MSKQRLLKIGLVVLIAYAALMYYAGHQQLLALFPVEATNPLAVPGDDADTWSGSLSAYPSGSGALDYTKPISPIGTLQWPTGDANPIYGGH